jgi:hypothetical protein
MPTDARARDAAEGWAEALGLEAEETRVTGELDGVLVRGAVWCEGRRPVLFMNAPFWPPLGEGLAVEVRPVLDAADFDQAFSLTATDLERGRALIPPEARRSLERLVAGGTPTVRDSGVTWVGASLEPLSHLPTAWRAIDGAARAVPPPPGFEPLVHALARVARAGVARSGAPPGLVGAIDGVKVAVFALRGGALRVAVRFPRPRWGRPLVVAERRHGWLARLTDLVDGRREIEVGDPDFDRRFAIRSYSAEDLFDVLGPRVRDALLRLDPRCPIRLDAEGIWGSVRAAEPGEAVVVAELALELADAVAEGLRHAG